MDIKRTSLGLVSISGLDTNGWAIALFFEQTTSEQSAAELYLLDSEGNDISIEGLFTSTNALVTALARALTVPLENLSSIPENLIENEIARLAGIVQSSPL